MLTEDGEVEVDYDVPPWMDPGDSWFTRTFLAIDELGEWQLYRRGVRVGEECHQDEEDEDDDDIEYAEEDGDGA